MARYPKSLDRRPPGQKRAWWRFFGRHLPSLSVTVLVALLMTTILFPYVVITRGEVDAGEGGRLLEEQALLDLRRLLEAAEGAVLHEARPEGGPHGVEGEVELFPFPSPRRAGRTG